MCHLSGICEVVVRHLREQVMHNVGADVVVDLVEHAKVPVDGGQPAAQVGPLLRARRRAASSSTALSRYAAAPAAVL